MKLWMGTSPTTCDICNNQLKKSFIDGRTKMGPWAIMCTACHTQFGVGLGIGFGQKYDLKTLKQIQKKGAKK